MNYLFLLNIFATFMIYECYNININFDRNFKNTKLCIDCKNYIRIKNLPEEFGVCKLFSPELNLINGKSLYYPAFVARKIDKLCGFEAKYHEYNDIVEILNRDNEK